MKSIDELCRILSRGGFEQCVMANGLPLTVRTGTSTKTTGGPLTKDTIVAILVSAGGAKYMDGLEAKSAQWKLRIEGAGTAIISARTRNGQLQVHVALERSEVPSRPTPGKDGGGRDFDDGEVTAPVPVKIADYGFAFDEVGGGGGGGEESRAPAMARGAVRGAGGMNGGGAPGPGAGAIASVSASASAGAVASANAGAIAIGPEVAGGARRAGAAGGEMHGNQALAATPSVDVDVVVEDQSGEMPVARRVERASEGGPVAARAYAPPSPPAPPRAAEPAAPPEAARPASPSASASAPRPSRPPVPALFTSLLANARAVGAADLHLIADRPVLMRIAGELVPRGDRLDPATVETMVHAIVPDRCVAELETHGSCDFSYDGEHGRFRVNLTRQRTGYKACLRVIPPQVKTLAELGLPESIAQATHHHQGLILVTGPTGHGKTTTLAAIVDIINRDTTHHVITVEDPVEFVHGRKRALMSQREVGTNTKSFASALKGSLREDPDVIVVGELRDLETVRMALSASETGHLMIGTMSTPSAARTIDRMIDLFPPSDQGQVRMTMASGLRLVVSQRLVPTADGKGLCAAVEILPGSMPLAALIREGRTYQIPSLQQRGKSLGIVRLDESLAELVRSGKTTMDIARGFAESPEELEALVTGKPKGGANAPPPDFGAKPEGKDGGLLSRAGSIFGGKKGS